VSDDQWERIRPHAALVDEVDVHAVVDRRGELGKQIQIPLPRLPVEFGQPVADQFPMA
jgi:hypothetical protein